MLFALCCHVLKVMVCWDVIPWSLVDTYRQLRGSVSCAAQCPISLFTTVRTADIVKIHVFWDFTQGHVLGCSTLKMRALWYFDKWGTLCLLSAYPVTYRNIPEVLDCQKHSCQNLRNHAFVYLFQNAGNFHIQIHSHVLGLGNKEWALLHKWQ
jgi:hypothetical protein